MDLFVQAIAITGIKATFPFQKGEDEYLKLRHIVIINQRRMKGKNPPDLKISHFSFTPQLFDVTTLSQRTTQEMHT